MTIEVHELKCLKFYFELMWDGKKHYEIRDNSDRDFHAGDKIILHIENDDREIHAFITSVLPFSTLEEIGLILKPNPYQWVLLDLDEIRMCL